jgi:nitrate/TMAO reductase-like tetraheme cytochrome c subunit
MDRCWSEPMMAHVFAWQRAVRRATPAARARLLALGCGLLFGWACNSDDAKPPLTREQLLDPETCKDCHPKHYEEWSSSMHAYATRDPVFVAMNKRGQEQANLGEFCVNCHAPMAVRENAITNFADLSDVPDHLQGVTCYFCHNAISVGTPHNNANIQLANDTTMRGVLPNPQKPWAHDVAPTPSAMHDPTKVDSSLLCGTCHDIMTPTNVHLERTLTEWEKNLTSKPGDGFLTCQSCHMRSRDVLEPAAPGYPGVAARKTHEHLWPGVDLALTPDMPNQDALRSAIERCEMQTIAMGGVEVTFGDNWVPGEPFPFKILIEQLAGHDMPSGASADRRLWVEVVAYDAAGTVLVESGQIAEGELEEKPMTDPAYDYQFDPFRDYLTDAQGNETHMFWEVANIEMDVLPGATVPGAVHYGERVFVTDLPATQPPARIEFWLRMRPMGVDVLQDLVNSGHLDPMYLAKMPTLTVTHREARLRPDGQNYRVFTLDDPSCTEYKCMLDPEQPFCTQ